MSSKETTQREDETQSAAQEQRQLKMHPHLLFSVIQRQAGTVSKALLELVMNSVDADATRVDITLNATGFRVADDGRGFRDRKEVEDFFEVFGTPHQSNDAYYGRFRMGRGQIMAFSRNTWKSGAFCMTVDIKTKGLHYNLKSQIQPPVAGCIIEGNWYRRLSPADLAEATRVLASQCRYTPIPVLLNEKRVSVDVAAEQWSYEDEDAYYRIDCSPTVEIYNRGVLVTAHSANQYGVGGVIVSKPRLTVNFARNDVIRSECKVWSRISEVLRERASEFESQSLTAEQTEEWREYQARRLLNWRGDPKVEESLANVPVITDVSGKHWSFLQLSQVDCEITQAPAGSRRGDKVQQSGAAIVVDSAQFARRFPDQHLLDLIVDLTKISMGGMLGLAAFEISELWRDFELVAAELREDHRILAPWQATSACSRTLNVLARRQKDLAEVFWEFGVKEFSGSRALLPMESDTAMAFTDGRDAIYFRKDLLDGEQRGPQRGIPWAFEITALLVHENLHDTDSGVGHVHDARFHELFHHLMRHPGTAAFVSNLFSDWTRSEGVIPGKYVPHIKGSEAAKEHPSPTLPQFRMPITPESVILASRKANQIPPSTEEAEKWIVRNAATLRMMMSDPLSMPETVIADTLPETDCPNPLFHKERRRVTTAIQRSIQKQAEIFGELANWNEAFPPDKKINQIVSKWMSSPAEFSYCVKHRFGFRTYVEGQGSGHHGSGMKFASSGGPIRVQLTGLRWSGRPVRRRRQARPKAAQLCL